jgi:hypothetical protein
LTDKLVVLHVLNEQIENFGATKIVRARLKELSEDKLYKLYHREQLGGTFERILNRLEQETAIVRVKNKEHKITVIMLNIPRIKNLIDEYVFQLNIRTRKTDMNIQDTTAAELDSVWDNLAKDAYEQALEENTLCLQVGERKSKMANLIALQTASETLGSMLAWMFEVYSPDLSFERIDKGASYDALRAALTVSLKNPNKPFSLVIRYNGIPDDCKFAEVLLPRVCSKIANHVAVFSEEVLGTIFSNEDISNLSVGRVDLLSSSARRCFDIFWKYHYTPALRTLFSSYKNKTDVN